MSFFQTIKALLPRSKAFDITHEGNLQSFFKGLSYLPDDIKHKTEEIFLDLFPDTTRALEEWENQFDVAFSNIIYGDNRNNILQALWQANVGGQSHFYLQSLLKQINEKIVVLENAPVVNPRDANAVFGCMCGLRDSVCGNKTANCGYKRGDSSFVPTVLRNGTDVEYDVPNISEYWENCFFVCGDAIRNSRNEIIYCQKLQLEEKWKSYLEYLILKIKPVQMTAILFIEYVPDGSLRRR